MWDNKRAYFLFFKKKKKPKLIDHFNVSLKHETNPF